MSEGFKVVVAHKGAREHFLAARALHRRGCLATLVTDWYSPLPPHWASRAKRLGPGVARALGAGATDLPRAKILAFNSFGLASRWELSRAEKKGCLIEAMARNDQDFARRVAQARLPGHDVFLGYSYAALEALQAERERGMLTLVDQIDPGRMEWDIIQEEAARWPQYAGPMEVAPVGYYERAVAEWKVAQLILVNSAWSRSALVKQGADPARIAVIPLAYEAAPSTATPPERRDGTLSVLWLGSVILRKGIAYLMEAAKQLAGEPVRFVVAGPSELRPEVMAQAPSSIQWLGQVPRSEVARLYQSADVFVLPTLSDGFAITQVEALAYGRPVVTTPNCGDVVEDGRTGFIVPARDATALADALRRFVRDPRLAGAMRPACLETAARFSIDAFADRLTSIIRKGLAAQAHDTAARGGKVGAP